MTPRTLRGTLDADDARRRRMRAETADDQASRHQILVQNQVAMALNQLDDPAAALAVLRRVQRGITERLPATPYTEDKER